MPQVSLSTVSPIAINYPEQMQRCQRMWLFNVNNKLVTFDVNNNSNNGNDKHFSLYSRYVILHSLYLHSFVESE